MKPIYSADSITKRFGTRHVLKSASIWAREGKITALFGRNGCGKSTLLKVGAGLMSPGHGAIHFAGQVYERPRLSQLAKRGLFYLPDRNLLSTRRTLRDQIRDAEWHRGADRTKAIVERMELGARLDQTSLQLSGGEQRRAELSLAMICAPRCLLADEPFAGIDPSDREVVAASLRDLAHDGCAIIVSGHEVSQVLSVADDVVWMVAGTTIGLGAPEAAVRNEQFQREYLGAIDLTR